MNTTVKCVFCDSSCSSMCCQSCNAVSRMEKFSRLLRRFKVASNSICYHDEFVALVENSRQVGEHTIWLNTNPYLGLEYVSTAPFRAATIIQCRSSSFGPCRAIIPGESSWLSERCVASSCASRWQLSLSLHHPSHE